MNTFVYLLFDEGYNKYIISAAKKAGYYTPVFKKEWVKKLFKLHNSEPLNRVIELPFKRIWFKNCVPNNINANDVPYFICFESFHLSYSERFLKFIKRTIKNSKTVFYFTNPVNEYNFRRIERIKQHYDLICTFCKKDADEYGYYYCNNCGYLLPDVSPLKDFQSDVFFVGSNKGRLDLLHSLFRTLSSEGLKCDFYITDVPEEKKEYPEIHYNQRISYDDVLRHVKSTRCVLEVLGEKHNYSSIRTYEAFQYKKKLLTTNKGIINEDWYDSNWIQVICSPEEIDISFFYTPIANKLNYDSAGTVYFTEKVISECAKKVNE